MADGKTHLIAGIATGTAAAVYTAREQQGVDFMAELIGGAVGGAIGGKLPDILEPAIHSWHRSTAHSVATAMTIGITAARSISAWQDFCHANAARQDDLCESATDVVGRAWHSFLAFLWRLLSGIVVGLSVGYLSHLALDAGTPRSIPLLA